MVKKVKLANAPALVYKSETFPLNYIFASPLVPGKYYAHGPITNDFKVNTSPVKVMFAPYK